MLKHCAKHSDALIKIFSLLYYVKDVFSQHVVDNNKGRTFVLAPKNTY